MRLCQLTFTTKWDGPPPPVATSLLACDFQLEGLGNCGEHLDTDLRSMKNCQQTPELPNLDWLENFQGFKIEPRMAWKLP